MSKLRAAWLTLSLLAIMAWALWAQDLVSYLWVVILCGLAGSGYGIARARRDA